MTFVYIVCLVLLGIYSYSQVDLNLTLLQAPWFLNFQHLMIQLGYYNRSLSTVIFLVLLALLALIKPKNIVVAIVGISILGLLSYPAFSHDVFNYIFDARIAVFHHANPYTSTALMFSGDDWTRFMNWTHRTYPYGPVFLPISILVYFLGFNKFILTLLLFKALFVGAYLGCCYIIHKLARSQGLIFFAFNPLIIIEGVLSPHLDILMLFFILYAFYKKNWLAYIISVGIKYATVLMPPFVKNLNFLVILAFIGAFIQIGSRELLPHYFIVPIGFLALVINSRLLVVSGVLLSIALVVIRYYSFILTGSWFTIGF